MPSFRPTAFVLLTLICALPCAAADPPETNDAIYGHAAHALKIGHDYERAIQQLQYLVAKDPANRKYHLALGCAEADRAASIGYAAMFTQMRADEATQYPQTLKDWEAAQRDPKSDNYGDPRPTPPPDRVFYTKDDDYPLSLTIPQATVRLNTLTTSALAEWKRCIALSATPADRAEAAYVQGWGIELLRLLQSGTWNGDAAGDTTVKGLKPLPTVKDAIASFALATKLAPQNALYWQSQGDALNAEQVYADPQDNTKALAAYAKALSLQPVNAPLWFRLYGIYNHYGNRQPVPARAALLHVVDSDPNNAYPHYLMAGTLFRETHYSDPHDKSETADQTTALTATYDAEQQKSAEAALTQMELGNSALYSFVPIYVHPYPEALSGFGSWQNILFFSDIGFGDMANMRELARAGGGYARIAAAHGDEAGLVRGTRAVIGMGIKMCGDWPTKDDPATGVTVIQPLVGIAIMAIGYNDLVKGETQIGNALAAQQAQAEYDTLKAKSAAYKAAINANLNANTTYDYY